jgi:hypothetical protein
MINKEPNLFEIQSKWNEILGDVHPVCRHVHRNAFPFRIENQTLYIAIEEKELNPKFDQFNLNSISRSINKNVGYSLKCEYFTYVTEIKIKEDYLRESVEFVVNTLSSEGTAMTKFDFQDQTNSRRKNEDYIIDVVEGKLAEYVFNEFSYWFYGLTFTIDNKIYNDTTWTDGGNDLLILRTANGTYLSNLKVDIKGTKKNSQWLLVEKKKAYADVYILVRVDFENENFLDGLFINKTELDNDNYKRQLVEDILSRFNREYKGYVVGYAYLSDIIDPETNKPWFMFKKDEKLITNEEVNNMVTRSPDINRSILDEYQDVFNGYVKLKAEVNYGLPAFILRKSAGDWLQLFNKIFSIAIPYNDQIYLKSFSNNIYAENRIENVRKSLENRRRRIK